MDFFHWTTKIVSRNKGKSAVAASAYISGTRMENTWDGVTHDYTRKKHVIYTEVMLPPNAPQEYADRNLLWNSVEWNETKANAQLARSIELALPAELNHEQNIALVRKLVQELFVDKGMCADVAFHDKGDGNPHAHILLTMRPLTPDGKWGDKSRLEYILDADGNRIPMVHEGPDARAMEKRGIPTEVGEKNREICQQNKLLIQLEARLARLNAWAQYEKKKDELLTAQGEDVSRESLRFKLASNILASSVQSGRKDHRLRDSTGLLSIMHEYNITDAASCLAAIQTVNTKFYGLKSKRKENHDLSLELSVRIESYEKWKKYQKHYRAWEKLPEEKRSGFERKYEYELRQYRQAASVLRRCQDDGEKIDYKGWKAALEYLEKEQFMLDYQLEDMKEEVRRLEVVKREFIRENKQAKPDRYAR